MEEHVIKDSYDMDSQRIEEFLQGLNEILQYYRIDQRDLDDGRFINPLKSSLSYATKTSKQGTQNNAGSSNHHDVLSSSAGGKGMAESKVQYLRQMIFQYLVCKEPEVKLHIETALMAIFRFTEEEKGAVEDKRREEESLDAFTSVSSFLGSLTSTSLV